jgi:hypothetical protein
MKIRKIKKGLKRGFRKILGQKRLKNKLYLFYSHLSDPDCPKGKFYLIPRKEQ